LIIYNERIGQENAVIRRQQAKRAARRFFGKIAIFWKKEKK
jgi:hypothetical protein